MVALVFSRKVSIEGHSAHTKGDLVQGLGGFSFSLSLPKWLPGFEVEEGYIDDGCSQGDSEDGVEEVDLLHDGHVGEAVLLLRNI